MKDTRITGEKIILRPLEKKDLADKVRWFNDPELIRLFFWKKHSSLKKP